MSLPKSYGEALKAVEAGLAAVCKDRGVPTHLRKAMEWSLLGGGKRVRPVLVLMADAALTGNPRKVDPGALRIALALECIHTYSLIHDDLPAMDDDVLRRGRPTCHVKFDEATAILAGDALLTLAFELVGEIPKQAGPVTAALARAAGGAGMVGGQTLDMDFEGKKAKLGDLRRIHAGKTGALLRASVELPGIYRGDARKRAALAAFGTDLGLAFQIADDILDATSTAEKMGKSVGADEKNGKSTYVSILGLDRARQEAAAASKRAVAALAPFRKAGDDLAAVARYVVERDH